MGELGQWPNCQRSVKNGDPGNAVPFLKNKRPHLPRRGGIIQRITMERAAQPGETAAVGGDRAPDPAWDIVALDGIPNALARLDPRKLQVVEMGFLGGPNLEETAEVLKVSHVTVMRDWSTAKAWLYREPTGGAGDGFRTAETSR